jgi:hypothetical protein
MYPNTTVVAEIYNEKIIANEKKEKKDIAIKDPPLKIPKIPRPAVLMNQLNEKPKSELVKKTTEFDLTRLQTEQLKQFVERPMEKLSIKKCYDDTILTPISSAFFNFSPPQSPQKEPIFFADLNTRDLAPGFHSVTILYEVPGTRIFCVAENFEDSPKFMMSILKAIHKCSMKKSPPGFDPVCEEMVLAKFQDVYYRACVIDKKDKNYTVVFVDYGNVETVKVSDIKPFDKSLMMDITVNEVQFQNLPVPLSKKAKAILEQPNGIEINVRKERSEHGGLIAEIVGLL